MEIEVCRVRKVWGRAATAEDLVLCSVMIRLADVQQGLRLLLMKTILPGPALIRREGVVHQHGVILASVKEIQHLLPVVIKEVPELQDLVVNLLGKLRVLNSGK